MVGRCCCRFEGWDDGLRRVREGMLELDCAAVGGHCKGGEVGDGSVLYGRIEKGREMRG